MSPLGSKGGSTVASNRRGYRQGLVLGLTMAEVMLLLLFCLMMAVAVATKYERDVRTTETARFQEEVADLRARLAAAEIAAGGNRDAAKKLADAEERVRRLEARLTSLLEDAPNAELVRARVAELERELARVTAELKAADSERTVLERLRTKASPELLDRLLERIAQYDKAGLTRLADAERSSMEEALAIAELNPTPEDWRELRVAVDTGIVKDGLPGRDELTKLRDVRKSLADAGLSDLSDPEARDRLDEALETVERQRRGEGLNEWPPIISLDEGSGFRFRRGSAELDDSFRRYLVEQASKQVAEIIERYGADVVEVVGHTDEQPLSPRTSNMDAQAIKVLVGRGPTSSMKPADNAGLGLARALSVSDVLRRTLDRDDIVVVPYSAGQFILPDETLTVGNDVRDARERRRIEIRVRRRNRPAPKVDE